MFYFAFHLVDYLITRWLSRFRIHNSYNIHSKRTNILKNINTSYLKHPTKENICLYGVTRKINSFAKIFRHYFLKESVVITFMQPEIRDLNTTTQVFHTYRINLSPFTKDFRVRGTINWESTNLSSSSFNEELPYCQTNTMCFNNWGKLVFNSSTYQFVAGIQLVRRVTWQRGRISNIKEWWRNKMICHF